MAELTVKAILENLDTVIDFINGQLAQSGCPMNFINQVSLAVEEIYVNIAHYAYNPTHGGEATIRCEVDVQPLQITVEFLDSGKPYNPLQKKDPDISTSAEEREIGGLGIFMVKNLMDEIKYDFVNGKNVLTMKKNIF